MAEMKKLTGETHLTLRTDPKFGTEIKKLIAETHENQKVGQNSTLLWDPKLPLGTEIKKFTAETHEAQTQAGPPSKIATPCSLKLD